MKVYTEINRTCCLLLCPSIRLPLDYLLRSSHGILLIIGEQLTVLQRLMGTSNQMAEFEPVPVNYSEASSRKKPKEVKFRRHLKVILVVVACLLFFLGGYVGGYFTPHQNDGSLSSVTAFPSEIVNSTTAATTTTTSWRNGPCEVLTSDHCPAGYKGTPSLLVVSLDGFRAEYLNRGKTPALQRIKTCGVHAPSMRPTHPAITFPNHYSIATGLNAESHGIIDNIFFDPELRRQFHYKQNVSKEGIWWKGEPIWVTAKKQGKRSHAYFWVGTEAPIQGIRPDVYLDFNTSRSFDNRVDGVLDWLSAPEAERPDITMLYFEEPDSAGHKFGTQRPELEQALRKVDATIDRLMQGLFDRKLLPCVNVIVVSDHGMEDSLCNKTFGLNPILESSSLNGSINTSQLFLYGGVQARISLSASAVSNTSLEDVYQALRCAAPEGPTSSASAYQIYRKKDLPRRLHYSNSPRVEPVIMNLNSGHTVYAVVGGGWPCVDGGMHGYDNMYASMQSIFLAHGPSFKTALEIEPFRNVELYNLMCELIDVQPAPNNGTAGSLHHVLRSPKQLPGLPVTQEYRPRFPDSEDEVRRRQNLSCIRGCAFDVVNGVVTADLRLNLTESDAATFIDKNAPFGIPGSNGSSLAVNVLVNRNSVIGYSNALKIPVWSTFTLRDTQQVSSHAITTDVKCVRNDVRLSAAGTHQCHSLAQDSSRDVVVSYLSPYGMFSSDLFDAGDEQTVANTVPMYNSFKVGMWASFWNVVARWRTKLSGNFEIHVGPVFDDLSPYGLLDPLANISSTTDFFQRSLPSHYFVIITRNIRDSSCISARCLPEVMAFLLSHVSESQYCQTDREYLLTHSATVDDVEKVTGLIFYSKLPMYEAIRLRTMQPTKLWDFM